MRLNSTPIPKWEKGTWWIIETHIVEDISEIDDGMERIGDEIYYHKYQVVGDEKINGKDAWIVDIKALRVPSEFPNDHGDNYLWRLYINKENFCLIRFETAVRSRRYLVTGQKVHRRTWNFSDDNPAVIASEVVLTPIDIPRLPSDEFPRWLSAEEKDFGFLNEDTSTKCWQHIDVIQENIDEKPTKVLYVTLSGASIGTRTQRWIPGPPCWQEWRRTREKGVIKGLWYAKMIDWSNKKKD